MHQIEQLIASGSYASTLDAARGWNEKQRRDAQKWLTANEASIRKQGHDERGCPWFRFLIAWMTLARDAKQAMAIEPGGYGHDAAARGLLLKAVALRGREWVEEFVKRATQHRHWHPAHTDLLVALCAAFDLPLPEDPDLPKHWCFSRLRALYCDAYQNYLARLDGYERVVPRLTATLLPDGDVEVESANVVAHTPVEGAAVLVAGWRWMLHALLARKDGILHLWNYYAEDATPPEMTTLADLLDRGLFDRRAFIGDLIAALIRGDAVTAQRLQAKCLALAAMPDIRALAPHTESLLGLLPSNHGSAVKGELELLRRLDKASPLTAEQFLLACQIVFARKEKGLHDEQLSWALQRWTTLPAQRPAIMRGLIVALDVDDFPFQKKVAVAVAERWAELEPSEQAALCASMAAVRSAVEPSVYAALAGGIGGLSATPLAESAPSQLPVTALAEARPLKPLVSLPVKAATYKELLADFDSAHSVLACEQLIDLLCRARESDRKALAVPVMSRLKPVAYEHAPLEVLAFQRLHEIQTALARGDTYPLISRPSYDNGSIEPEDLLTRLRDIGRAGLPAGPMDFLLALIRTRQPDPQQIEALRTIGSAQANVAADFFAAGGMAQMASQWQIVENAGQARSPRSYLANWTGSGHPEVCVTLQGLRVPPAIPDIPMEWAAGYTPATAPEGADYCMYEHYLTGMLPNNGEILAAWYLWGFRKAGHDTDTSCGKSVALALPAFLHARGPAGPALHLAVLFAMSGNEAESRIAGSDALLDLIAQQRYDSDLAVTLVAATIDCGSVKPGRLAKSLAQVVDAAGPVLWPLLRSAIGVALTMASPPAGSHELLALASRVVPGWQIRESIEILAKTAAGKGSSKLLVEARRLQHMLAD